MGGNGEKLRQTLSQLSGVARIFAEGSGNIVDIIKNLQIFVSALRDSKEQIVLFQNRLASLTSVVNDSRSDLDARLTNLSVAIGEVQRFVAGSRDQTSEQIQRLGQRHCRCCVDNRLALENVLHITPNAIANFENIYYPNGGSVTGAFSLSNFSNPVWFVCGLIGGVANTTAPETAKLCAQYLGPRAALAQLQQPSVPDQRLPAARGQSGPDRSTPIPKLAPGGAGPGRSARDPADGVRLHRPHGDIPPPPGWNAPSGSARDLPARHGRARDAVAGAVPRRADSRAAATSCRTSSSLQPPTVDGLLPTAPGQPRRRPNAPLLPAEGMPPS